MSGNTVLIDGATLETAEIDSNRRLRTRATTVTLGTSSAMEGRQYSVSAPILELTTDDITAILYCKNQDSQSRSWSISTISVTVNECDANANGDWFIHYHINDNTSNIAISGNDFTPTPLNVGSTTPLGAIAKSGGTGFSFNPSPVTPRLVTGTPREISVPLDSIIIPAGASVGLSVTPPTGNTLMKVDASFTAIVLDGDE